MSDETAWALEERLWLDWVELFERALDPDCIMALPGAGALRAAAILDSLPNAPRRTSVVISDRAVGRPSEGLVVLGYAAEARRDGSPPYRCLCTSTWRLDEGEWRLVQHQQTAG